MGNAGTRIKDFFVDAGKAIAKAGTSALGAMVPIIGKPLADKVNSMYRKGGKAMKFDMGGVVPAGLKAKVVNTPAQLMAVIEKFPELAEKHGLTVDAVKEAVSTKKKGGRTMEEHTVYAHGGVVSLPVSNLDRLNRMEHGGYRGYMGLPIQLNSRHAEPYAHGGHVDSVVLHHGDLHHGRMKKKHLC